MIEFSKARSSHFLLKLFNKSGLHALFDAFDFGVRNTLPSIFDDVAESMNVLLCAARVRCAMTEYANLLIVAFKRFMDIEQTMEFIQDL